MAWRALKGFKWYGSVVELWRLEVGLQLIPANELIDCIITKS